MHRDHRPRSTGNTRADQLVTALLAVGATARVTRLVSKDDFPFRRLRDWSLTRFGEHGWLSRLLECPWCVGVWIAAPATWTALRFGHTRWWRALAAWMALSMAASSAVVLTHSDGPDVAVIPATDQDGATEQGGADAPTGD
jgi:hypothetical protein